MQMMVLGWAEQHPAGTAHTELEEVKPLIGTQSSGGDWLAGGRGEAGEDGEHTGAYLCSSSSFSEPRCVFLKVDPERSA